MKLHPRERKVREAEVELSKAMTRLYTEHGLTTAEALRVVADASNSFIQGLSRIAIREERHGELDKPGGLV